MKILIGEDEVIIAEHIKDILLKYDFSEIETAYDKESIIKKIDSFKPDICILDIRMEGQYDGIEIGEYIDQNYNFPIIYLTAQADKDTVEKALKTKPSAYIVKPFTAIDVYTSIQIAVENLVNKEKDNYLILKTGVKNIKVASLTIMYLKAENPYVGIHTSDKKKYLERSSLDNILLKINNPDFIRIHRSYAVNINYVDSFSANKVCIGKISLAISRRNQEKMAKYFKR